MKQAGCLLVFVSAWTILLIPVVEQSPILTQEGFDLERFLGRWYEVATMSTCRFYMQRKEGNPVIVALELKHVTSEQNFTMASSTFRNGTCKETSTVYSLTDFPGQFFHHVARFGADVDSFVVHTNYDDYAMMLLLGTEKPSGIKTTTVKLYSRTEEMDSTVLNQFKNLVRQHGMKDDSVIINQYKGECVPGGQVNETTARPQAKKKPTATCR